MAVGVWVRSGHSPSNLNKTLERIYEEAQLTCELSLTSRKLKKFPRPASEYNLSDTVNVELSNNQLSDVPDEICKYRSLERLYIDRNAIKVLSESLAHLQLLTHLYLGRNYLTVLPACLCQLSSLQVLDVSGNRLVSLPDEICSLRNLSHLDVSHNQIQRLPPSLGDLDDLKKLRLRRNLIQTVPTELCFLRLVVLDLSFNQISSLPTELRFMSSLVTLSVEANPLSHPPATTCMRGYAHIFKWLDKAAAKQDKKKCVSEVEFRKQRKYTPVQPPTDIRLVSGIGESLAKRSTLDSGYSTSENGDHRWSQSSQDLDSLKSGDRKHHRGYSSKHSYGSNSLSMDSSSFSENGSAVSTPSTLSPGESFNLEDEFHKAMKLRQDSGVFGQSENSDFQQRVDPEGSGSSEAQSHSFDNSAFIGHARRPHSSTLGHSPVTENDFKSSYLQNTESHSQTVPIPTYREYLEAKRQQRALVTTNIYKRSVGDGISPTNEHNTEPPFTPRVNPVGQSLPPNIHDSADAFRRNDPKEFSKAHVKSVQKEAVLSYVKSRVSPTKSSPSSPDHSFDSTDSQLYRHTVTRTLNTSSSSPVVPHNESLPLANAFNNRPQVPPYGSQHVRLRPPTPKSLNIQQNTPARGPPPRPNITPVQNGVKANTFNSNIPKTAAMLHNQKVQTYSAPRNRKFNTPGRPFDPENTNDKNSFTYRREIEKHQHEKILIDNLRNIIETRLKVSLPADVSSALMDGVVLCHLVNHVRPRAVSSIHVPSPASPKLTVAKCRLNVENFLDACRRVGVEEAVLCSCDDIVAQFHPEPVLATIESIFEISSKKLTTIQEEIPPAHGAPMNDSMKNLDKTLSSSIDQLEPSYRVDVHLWNEQESHTNLLRKEPSEPSPMLSHALLLVFIATLIMLYVFPPD